MRFNWRQRRSTPTLFAEGLSTSLFALLVAAQPPLAARAQAAELLQPTRLPYQEVYLDNPKVSGNNLVGLRWKSTQTRFDPDSVHIQRPASASINTICVEVMSKDGRYTAENTYELAKAASPSPGFKSRTQFSDKLDRYPADDVSIIVHDQPCDTATLPLVVPAFLASGSQSGPVSHDLTAFVNADPTRVATSIIDPVGNVFAFTCGPAGAGVQIAFATECTLNVPATLHGEVTLRIAQKERFKTTATNYSVLLP